MGVSDFFKFPFVVPKWGAFFAASLISMLRLEGVPHMIVYHKYILNSECDYIIGK